MGERGEKEEGRGVRGSVCEFRVVMALRKKLSLSLFVRALINLKHLPEGNRSNR